MGPFSPGSARLRESSSECCPPRVAWDYSTWLLFPLQAGSLEETDPVSPDPVAGSDVRKSFQMIRSLPFLSNGDVDMA